MSRKVLRALFAAALVLPMLSACSGSIVDPSQNCGPEPETLQYTCTDK